MRQLLHPLCALTLALMVSAPLAIGTSPVFAHPQTTVEPSESAIGNWASVNQELSQTLLTADIGALARAEIRKPAPKTPKAWLWRLALLVRADYPDAALKLLKTRPPFLDAKTNWGIQSAIGDISEYGDVVLSKRLCELFPEDDTSFSWFDNWTKTVSSKEVDRWLKDREKNKNPEWYYVRLRFRARLGTEHELLAPLEKAIRDHPDDYDRLDKYLTAMDSLRQVKGESPLEWLTPVLKPRLAVQGFLFARNQSLPKDTCIALYEKSLALPFTKQDAAYYEEFQRKYSAHRRGEEELTEKNLRAWTKMSLMYLYQDKGQPQKAQQLLEQLVKENPSGSMDDYQGAGDIQRTSGARFFEAKILAEEPVEKAPEAPDSSADAVTAATYWLDRADYYIGRKEEARVMEAFDKAMKLVPPIGTDAETLPIRGRIVAAYSAYLCEELHRPIAAYDFVHKLLESVPITDAMVPMLVQQLQSLTKLSRDVNWQRKQESDDDSNLPPILHLDSNDLLLWAYLASLVTRSDRIQAVAAGKRDTLLDYDLLENLFEEAPKEKREVLWQRAEDLLEGDSLPDRFALAQKVSYGSHGKHSNGTDVSLPRRKNPKQPYGTDIQKQAGIICLW